MLSFYREKSITFASMKAPTISMGKGKIMVEFFSAEIVARDCKYLLYKYSTGYITNNCLTLWSLTFFYFDFDT